MDEITQEQTKKVIKYLDTLSISDALFWYIECSNETHPWQTDVFFYLRERVKNEK